MAEQPDRVPDGYEIYRPNRESDEAKRTKALTALLFLVVGGLIVLITIGGWSRMEGVTLASFLFAVLFVVFAFFVYRWQRGLLPIAMAIGVLTVIFATLAVPSWFSRDKSGFDSPLLPEPLVGLLVIILIPIMALTIAVSMIAFNQKWHVEEERPIEGHEAHEDDYDYDEYDDEGGHGSRPSDSPTPGSFTPGSASSGA
jgi:lysylphosphatidylglycerol synthetase-like protein (DUF2156 family)